MGATINGNEFSATSVEVKLGGQTFVGVNEINYSDEVDVQAAPGFGPVNLGRVLGEYKATLDFTMLRSEADKFEAKLGSPLSSTSFNVGVSYVEIPGAGTVNDEIDAVVVMKRETGPKRGEASTIKYSCFAFLPIRWNGRTLVANPQQGIALTASIPVLAV